MEAAGLMRARARLAHALRHGDGAVLAALALLAVAAALHWGAAGAMRVAIAQARQDTAAAQERAQAAGRAHDPREALPAAARLEQFYRTLPARTTAPDWLEKIHDTAARHGLQLAEGEYRMVRASRGRLVAYQATLPLKGSYAQVRRFLAQVMREVPTASLDDVGFRRDSTRQGEVQATVRLTVHMKEAP